MRTLLLLTVLVLATGCAPSAEPHSLDLGNQFATPHESYVVPFRPAYPEWRLRQAPIASVMNLKQQIHEAIKNDRVESPLGLQSLFSELVMESMKVRLAQIEMARGHGAGHVQPDPRRDEFETAAEYEQRIARRGGVKLVVLPTGLVSDSFSFRYAVDHQVLLATFNSRRELPPSRSLEAIDLLPAPAGDMRSARTVGNRLHVGSPQGTTGTDDYKVYTEERQYFVVKNLADFTSFNGLLHEPSRTGSSLFQEGMREYVESDRVTITIPMDGIAARSLMSKLRVAVGVSLAPNGRVVSRAVQSHFGGAAGSTMTEKLIEAQLHSLVIFNGETREPLATYVYLPPAAD